MATAVPVSGYSKPMCNGNPMGGISVDPLTHDPMAAWQRIHKCVQVKTKQPMDRQTPVRRDHVRFVCISDTHGKLEKESRMSIPDGDVLLHAGDVTMSGSIRELKQFNSFLGKFRHKHKVVIGGNHDLSLDDELQAVKHTTRIQNGHTTQKQAEYLWNKYRVRHPREVLTNCIYLQDNMVELSGIRIYGSPWQPEYGTWGFQLARGEELLQKWNLIPDNVDILMTHGPPVGFGDTSHWDEHAGCVDLLNTVQQRVRPVYHIFGHIHEGYGMQTDGATTFINASTCARGYKPINPPIVFDLPLPKGHMKDESPHWPLATASTSETNCKSCEDYSEKLEENNMITHL